MPAAKLSGCGLYQLSPPQLCQTCAQVYSQISLLSTQISKQNLNIGPYYIILRQLSTGIQWNPSCEANPFSPEMWPFKRGGLSSGVEINTFMFRLTLSSGLSRGVGLSSGWPLKRGSTVCICMTSYTNNIRNMSWVYEILISSSI